MGVNSRILTAAQSVKGIKSNLIAVSFLSCHNGSDIYVVSLCQFFYLQARWFQNLAKLEDSYIASWKAGPSCTMMI